MYEQNNFKERMKRDLGLAAIVAAIVAIAYFLGWLGFLNLP